MRTYLFIALFLMAATSSVSGQTIESTQTAFIYLYRGIYDKDTPYEFNVNDSEDLYIKANEKRQVTVPAGSTKISVSRADVRDFIAWGDYNFKAEAGKSYYFKIQRRASDIGRQSTRLFLVFDFDIVEVTERMYLKETNQDNR
jgi:hypothetical protein